VSLLDRQQAFGYTQEDLKFLLAPMATPARKPSARWAPTRRLGAVVDKSKLLYTYFKQNFAQVTNPPIDPIREELVMSLVSFIGPRPNLLDLEAPRARSAWKCASRSSPTRTWRRSARSATQDNDFLTKTLGHHLSGRDGALGMEKAITNTVRARRKLVHGGYNIIILSDRRSAPTASRSRRCWRRRRCTTT
jgi:glutamate synthase (NADPH/NADH) large chain